MSANEKRTIEIRAAEGGEDARLFVAELAQAYCRLAEREDWKYRSEPHINLRSGHQQIVLHIEGKNASRMDNEAGGHRLQRIPPTERKGRVHSSSVTVAVFDGDQVTDGGDYAKRSEKDFRIEWYNGTIKAGGQHHQKNATCCRLIHIPTSLVRTSQTRSRKNSYQLAMESMISELDRLAADGEHQAKNSLRRNQMGSGERSSEKRRTWRFQSDEVIDHATGRRASAHKAIAGHLKPLWSAM